MAATEKVIRISVEDSGVSSKVQRIGQDIREAFADKGMTDILEEADKRFSDIREKIKFIKDELKTIRASNESEYGEEVKRISSKGGSAAAKNAEISRLDKNYNQEQKTLEKLIEALNKFKDKVDPLKPIPGGGNGFNTNPYTNALKDLLSGNMIGAVSRVKNATESKLNDVEGIGTRLALAFGVATASVVGAVELLKRGNDDLRSENQLKRVYNSGTNSDSEMVPNAVGLSRQEYNELKLRTGLSRRSGAGLASQTFDRALMRNSYGLNEQDFNGLDRFYRRDNNGNMKDVSGMDANRTILDILVRAEKQGLLGIGKNDFTMLPEKIGQVQAIMQMQSNNGERTNAAAAVNLMLAGNRIGGRFGDDRLHEAMGRIDGSIRNPSSPGMRAFMFNLLSKANPGSSYTDILGQMENGASKENLKAIMPSISQLPQGELRRMVLFQLTKNMQDAIRLDASGNLRTMLGQLDQNTIGDADVKRQSDVTGQRNMQFQTALDVTVNYLKNNLTDLGRAFADAVERLNGTTSTIPSTNTSKPNTQGNKLTPAK